jgi:hypothetical protein
MAKGRLKELVTPATPGMQYMLAHGATPGPTQRPTLAGLLTGAVAAVPAIYLLIIADALYSMAKNTGVTSFVALAIQVVVFVLAGAFYGWLFGRAANDRHGGWLFGISFGFLLWVAGPGTVLQWVLWKPLAVGRPAMGLFGGNLLYGVLLGLLFPWIHDAVKKPLSEMSKHRPTSAAGD